MPDTAYPWDIKFTIGETEYGFMLATPKGQSKQIVIKEPEAESSRVLDRMNNQDVGAFRDFNATIDTPMSMSSFIGGCGQLDYDFGDETSYWWGSGIVTHIDGKVYPAPPASTLTLSGATGGITGVTTYVTALNARYDFLWEGVNLWRRDASNATNAWAIVYSTSVPITDFKIFNGKGLIAVPTHATSTTDYMYQADVTAAATWSPTVVNATPMSNSLGKPKYWEVVRGSCYALVDNNRVFVTTDPTADGWVGPIDTAIDGNIAGPPGDTTYSFVGANAVGDFIFTRKKNVIYSIDSQQDVIEVVWQWKDNPSEYNFKYASTSADQLVYSAGPECFAYDPQTGTNARLGLSRKSGFSVKEILGVAGDSRYIYVLAKVRVPIIRSADSVVLFRCIKDRGSSWTFECLWEDTNVGSVTYGYLKAISAGTSTRLYWGQDNASDTKVYLMDVPSVWDETTTGSFATGASLWTSISRSGFPGFEKHHLYFNMNTLNLSATNTITVKYSIDSGASFTSLVAGDQDIVEVNYTDKHSRSIIARFDFVSDGTICPILLNFDHHQRISFKYLPQIQATVRIASRIETRNRSISNRLMSEIWDDIVTLRIEDGDILYSDFLGNEFRVTVDTIAVNPTRHENPVDYEEEAVIVITRSDRGA